MKKIYFLMIFALLGVAGCNNDDSELTLYTPELALSDINLFIAENSDFAIEDIPELLCGDKTWMKNALIRYTDESLSEIAFIHYVNWQGGGQGTTMMVGATYPARGEGCGDVYYKDGTTNQWLYFSYHGHGWAIFGLTGHYEMNWEIIPERKAIVCSGIVDKDYERWLGEKDCLYEPAHFHGEYNLERRILALSENRMIVVDQRRFDAYLMEEQEHRRFVYITEYIAVDGVKFINPGDADGEKIDPDGIKWD